MWLPNSAGPGTPGAPQLTGLAPLWIPRGRATGLPVSCLWGRLRCSQGSWLRLAGCGPKAIIHSGGPLPLCPFSLLPAIPGVPEEQKQPLTCQLQGQAGTKGQEDRGRALGTKRVSFREEDLEAETFQGQESRLPLLHCDSVQLLRQRAKKSRPVHKEPEEVAAAASQSEASQPAESSADRAGVLPPINQVTQSPQRQPPNTKAPPRRKATRYPR